MSDSIKVKALDVEEKSIAEKEETVLENAGVKVGDDSTYKVNLSKPETDAVQEQETDESVLRGSSENEEAGEEAKVELQEVQQEETPVVEEIIDEETSDDKATVVAEQEESKTEPVEEQKEESIDLPENVQELVKFMNETGGSMEDYLRLSADYTDVDEKTLLKESPDLPNLTQ